jgi:hypothetical protein
MERGWNEKEEELYAVHKKSRDLTGLVTIGEGY